MSIGTASQVPLLHVQHGHSCFNRNEVNAAPSCLQSSWMHRRKLLVSFKQIRTEYGYGVSRVPQIEAKYGSYICRLIRSVRYASRDSILASVLYCPPVSPSVLYWSCDSKTVQYIDYRKGGTFGPPMQKYYSCISPIRYLFFFHKTRL